MVHDICHDRWASDILAQYCLRKCTHALWDLLRIDWQIRKAVMDQMIDIDCMGEFTLAHESRESGFDVLPGS